MEKNTEALLAEVREDIDSIDREFLPLFIRRMQCSERVAKIKTEAHLPVLNAKREQEILERVRSEAGEYGSAAVSLYSSVMAISRERQHGLMERGEELLFSGTEACSGKGAKILCQGVEGAYSHRAASILFPEGVTEFRPDFESVFLSLGKNEGDFGVIPVENSAAGSVAEVYSLIMKYRYFIVGAVSVTVDHQLAVKGAGPVKKVISHPQALMQCAEYIKGHGYEREEFSNTAAAAKYVSESSEEGLAAICSREAAETYGLTVLDQTIQDDKNNHTRFAVVSQKPIFREDADKISLCFSIPNLTGSLYRVLERFALRGLNLTKIESRPIRGSNFEYDFYLDFAGNMRDEGVRALLSSLKMELPRFTFLGNYRETM